MTPSNFHLSGGPLMMRTIPASLGWPFVALGSRPSALLSRFHADAYARPILAQSSFRTARKPTGGACIPIWVPHGHAVQSPCFRLLLYRKCASALMDTLVSDASCRIPEKLGGIIPLPSIEPGWWLVPYHIRRSEAGGAQRAARPLIFWCQDR